MRKRRTKRRRPAPRGRTRDRGRRERRSPWRRRARIAGWLALLLVAPGLVLVLPWRFVSPPTTAFIVRAARAGPLEPRPWFGWRDISREVAIAVVAAEDQKFPRHRGFDFGSIANAIEERHSRPRGASTISQQLAKNLFLWSERSVVRKGIEAYFTVFIEGLWPKRRILEVYLNVVEFGPGVFGVGAASRRFYGKTPAALSRRESSLLAAVLPNPKARSAANPSPAVLDHAAAIRRKVAQLGGTAYLRDL